MKQQKNKDEKAAKQLLNAYNMLANLFWSVPSLLPLTVYCYRYVSLNLLFLFLVPALLFLFLPNHLFNKMQAAKATFFYKRIGVDLVNCFSQNGAVIHRLLKKRFPAYKAVRYSQDSIKRLVSQSYVYEKFHFAAAVFFTLLTLQAFTTNLFGWATVLTLINVVYNVYPILFQQYVRLKLGLFSKPETKQAPKFNAISSCQLFLRSVR